jgi:endonuclease/exonuclease/phosphatase (EEP) superfamily protein YafD
VRRVSAPAGRLATVLAGIGALAGAAGLAGVAADWAWPGELAVHFRVQYAVVLAACAAGLALLGRPAVAAGCLALAAANAAFAWPYLHAVPAPAPRGGPLSVVSVNVFRRSHDYRAVLDFVRARDPDVAVFLEATPEWRAALAALADRWPYEAAAPGAGSDGILVRSRLAVASAVPLALGGQAQGALAVRLAPHGHPLELVAVHLEWPVLPESAASRNRELAGLAAYAARARVPLVAIGDFNATRYTPPFARMLADGGLSDCAAGRGLHATWPAWVVPAWIQIDHCLHGAGIAVDRFEVGPFVGSDHYPLVVALRVPASPALAAAPAVEAMPPVSASRIAASTGMSTGWSAVFGR